MKIIRIGLGMIMVIINGNDEKKKKLNEYFTTIVINNKNQKVRVWQDCVLTSLSIRKTVFRRTTPTLPFE